MTKTRKLRMRPRAPWRPVLSEEQEREIAAAIPDGFYVSIVPQRAGLYRIHLFREGRVPPVASRHEVTNGLVPWAVETLVAQCAA